MINKYRRPRSHRRFLLPILRYARSSKFFTPCPSFLCLLPFSGFISVVAIKGLDKEQLSGGFIWLPGPDYSSSLEEVQAGTQAASHPTSRQEQRRAPTLPACLLLHAAFSFFREFRNPCPGNDVRHNGKKLASTLVSSLA